VWHTGTLNGMYSMLALLPDRRSGFVFMINGDADDARTVLGQVLMKHFTAPGDPRDVRWYADAIARQAKSLPPSSIAPDIAAARASALPAPASASTRRRCSRSPPTPRP
jgi:hypothetical protein